MTAFEKEWEVLQNQYDSYEKSSLLVKCLAITLSMVGVIGAVPFVYLVCLVATLWLQDAIWKTFQSRIEQRLYVIEEEISLQNASSVNAFQFNRQFLDNRPNQLGLVKAYLGQAIRPTVAFPYVVLIALILVCYL